MGSLCKRWVGLLVLAAVCAAGCGDSTTGTVSGEVTYEGKPVETGYITFHPADGGKGTEVAAPIKDGRFTVANLSPGPKMVHIAGNSKVEFARTTEELRQQSRAKPKVDPVTGLIPAPDAVPNDAEGNRVRVVVEAGTQTMNFPLKKPAAKKQ